MHEQDYTWWKTGNYNNHQKHRIQWLRQPVSVESSEERCHLIVIQRQNKEDRRSEFIFSAYIPAQVEGKDRPALALNPSDAPSGIQDDLNSGQSTSILAPGIAKSW